MAILPVYTTSKMYAARINLTPSSTPGVSFNYVKGRGFSRKWAWFAKIFAAALARPTLPNPLHEILDPPLVSVHKFSGLTGAYATTAPV